MESSRLRIVRRQPRTPIRSKLGISARKVETKPSPAPRQCPVAEVPSRPLEDTDSALSAAPLSARLLKLEQTVRDGAAAGKRAEVERLQAHRQRGKDIISESQQAADAVAACDGRIEAAHSGGDPLELWNALKERQMARQRQAKALEAAAAALGAEVEAERGTVAKLHSGETRTRTVELRELQREICVTIDRLIVTEEETAQLARKTASAVLDGYRSMAAEWKDEVAAVRAACADELLQLVDSVDQTIDTNARELAEVTNEAEVLAAIDPRQTALNSRLKAAQEQQELWCTRREDLREAGDGADICLKRAREALALAETDGAGSREDAEIQGDDCEEEPVRQEREPAPGDKRPADGVHTPPAKRSASWLACLSPFR
eukprot:TRINITY_DN36022_c0_g1_i1.p1 TRINITY_DN36022_c0_g1~~TRINITY_DN36022_c0_g1_i1.p1  ORF type:complete len:397 (+),score=174.70 TRINITY_DN36022_c0_g1_i1:66-1193(+)